MTQKRILYADDNVQLLKYFVLAAQRAGHNFVAMNDAARGWELIQQGERFDLIISDHDMPEMSGFDFLKKIRDNPATANVPFVLYSGNDSSTLAAEVVKLGAVFASKAIIHSFSELIATHLPRTT